MASRADVQAKLVDQILTKLDEGTVPWHQPWASAGLQRNAGSGRPYRGINQIITMLSGYGDPRWTTFKGAKKLGGAVRKGERGTAVALWKRIQVRDEEAEGGKKIIPILRYYTVFNVEQCDGLELPPLPNEVSDHQPIENAEAIFAEYVKRERIKVSNGGDRAFYRPSTDSITLPALAAFDSPDAYHAVSFHEAAHSTGHKERLDRKLLEGGIPAYSEEELVAEMSAAFLSAEAGIDVQIDTSAAYIDHWRKQISDDKGLVIKAASAAQKAVDRILNVSFEEAPKE